MSDEQRDEAEPKRLTEDELLENPAQQRVGRAVKLHPWQRWVSGGVAISLSVAALYAVLHKGMEGAAIVAILALALVLGLLAIIGNIPYRLWGKDMGLEWGDTDITREAAEAIADALPQARRAEVRSALAGNSMGVPIVLGDRIIGEIGSFSALSRALAEAEEFDAQCRSYVMYALTSPQILGLGKASVEDASKRSYDIGDLHVDTSYGTLVFEFQKHIGPDFLMRLDKRFNDWYESYPIRARLIVLTATSGYQGDKRLQTNPDQRTAIVTVTNGHVIPHAEVVERVIEAGIGSLRREIETDTVTGVDKNT